jgi:alpha-L-rhamnosidase
MRKPYTGLFVDEVTQNTNLGIANQKIAAAGGTEGLLVLKNPSQNATPLFRTVVKPQKKIRKARLYITSRGIYEIHSNGKRLGTDYFNPGLTQYNKHQLYQTYDLTSEFKNQTETVLGIALSEGWWSGNITYSGENWNFFGDRQSFLALIVLTHEDGTEQILTSNTEDWKLYTEGPLRYGSFFQGEVYDARYHSKIAGWSTPQYDDSAWKAPSRGSLEGTTYTDKNFNFKDLKLLGKRGENVKIVKKIKPVSVQEVRPKVYVYDMGQNMVGFPKIQLPKTEAWRHL